MRSRRLPTEAGAPVVDNRSSQTVGRRAWPTVGTVRTGPGGITARGYEPSDFGACMEIFQSNVPAYFTEEERDEFGAFLNALPGPYLVVRDPAAGVVACGGYALADDGAVADFCWGMVRRELHGMGLGRALAEWRIEAITSEPGIREIALHTSQHTRGFYELLGFELRRVVTDGYAPGLHRCEMRYVLPAAPAPRTPRSARAFPGGLRGDPSI